MNNKIIVTSASNLDCYDKKILFTLKDYKGLFVGEKKFYKTLGEYDNFSNSLIKITKNEKILNLLNSNFSGTALAGWLYSGRYSLADIIEYYQICSKLNKKYYPKLDISEKENKIFYKLENKYRRENDVI